MESRVVVVGLADLKCYIDGLTLFESTGLYLNSDFCKCRYAPTTFASCRSVNDEIICPITLIV